MNRWWSPRTTDSRDTCQNTFATPYYSNNITNTRTDTMSSSLVSPVFSPGALKLSHRSNFQTLPSRNTPPRDHAVVEPAHHVAQRHDAFATGQRRRTICPASSSDSLSKRQAQWEPKSDIYILRSDGFSCSRETVTSDAALKFEHPSSQQHLLAWKTRPKCVLVLKKLGDELLTEFQDIIRFLGEEQGLRVLVEPNVYDGVSNMVGI